MTLTLLLVLLALVFTVASVVGKLPLWSAVLLLVILHLIAAVPLR